MKYGFFYLYITSFFFLKNGVISVIFSSINAIIHLTVYGAGTTSLLSITYTYPHHSYGALFLCLKGIKTTAQGDAPG